MRHRYIQQLPRPDLCTDGRVDVRHRKPSRPRFPAPSPAAGGREGQFLTFKQRDGGEWPVLLGYAVRPSAAQWPHPVRLAGSGLQLPETTLKAVCRQLLRRARRILRRVQPEMTSACASWLRVALSSSRRHRRKDRCRLANRPAGTFHPAVADFNTVKHARAHGQGLRGFLPGRCTVSCPSSTSSP